MRHAAYQFVRRLSLDIQQIRTEFKVDAPIDSLASTGSFSGHSWQPLAHHSTDTDAGARIAAGSGADPSISSCNFSSDSASASNGSRPEGSRVSDQCSVLGSSVTLAVRSVTVHNESSKQYGVLATACRLTGLDLGVTGSQPVSSHGGIASSPAHEHQPEQQQQQQQQRPYEQGQHVGAEAGPRQQAVQGVRVHMVQRWSAGATVEWRLASRVLDSISSSAPVPVLQVAATLLLSSSGSVTRALLAM